MGLIIFLLMLALIAQSVRVNDYKNSLGIKVKIIEAKAKYINILEEENKDYQQCLFGQGQWLFGQGLFKKKVVDPTTIKYKN